MEEHTADKRKGEANEIPEGHVAVSSGYRAGVEVLVTEPEDEDEHYCEECGESFDSHEAYAGHLSSHNGEDEE